MSRFSFTLTLSLLLLPSGLCLAQPFPKPGPEHEALKKMEGTWDAVVTITGNLKAKGTMTCRMECGGLWLVRDTETNLGGLKLQTKILEGYDPVKKQHISIQVDSLTTVPMIQQGTYDEAGKTLTLTGEARDFDGKPEQVKSVCRRIDDDHETIEVYRVYPDGKEAKHLTIEYTRRKDAT